MTLRFLLLRFFLLIFLLSCFNGYTQLYSSGQDPASVKWMQIKTEKFQIIFHKGFEKQAQYFANTMDEVYQYATKSLKANPRSISIILHSQNIIPNGVTAWAPRRIDVYTVSPQNTYAENWFKQLAVHEYRHVVQIERLHEGFAKALAGIFGEQLTGGLFGTFLPNWFIEGDAVVAETALSNSGRGRLPSFEMLLRAQLLEKGIYSYEKAVHGSFKDFIPNEYHLGYYLVSYGREKYGIDFWDQAMANVARNPIAIKPFSSGMKKAAGISKREFYLESLNHLKEKWARELKDVSLVPFQKISSDNKYYTNYRLPCVYNEGIILQKSGIDQTKELVLMDKNGIEKKLLNIGPSLSQSLSVGNDIVCWAEIIPDARWSNRNFSEIKLYNLKTKQKRSLTKKSRYFAPKINRNGNRVLAVEVNLYNQFFLTIIDVKTANVIERFKIQNASAVLHPAWSEDENEIIFTTVSEQGKDIRVLNLNSKETDIFYRSGYIDISKASASKNYVYFIGAYTGIDNVYLMNRKTGEVRLLTSVKYGIGDYAIKDQELYISNYTADGYEIATQTIPDKNSLRRLSELKQKKYHYADIIKKQENHILSFDKKPLKNYEVTKYSKFSNLFNVHSWGPVSVNADDYEVKPGFTLMAQNKLSSAFTTLGYEYDLNDKAGRYFLDFEYRGWYPVLNTELEYIKKRGQYRDTLNNLNPFTYHEFNTEAGISLPLNLSRGNIMSGIKPGMKFINSNQKVDDGYPIKFTESNVQIFNYDFTAYTYKRKSLKDVYPEWGGIFVFNYYHTPYTKLEKGNLTSYESVIYVPGLFNHHGIKLYGGYQKRQFGAYNFGNEVDFVRGLVAPAYENLYSFRGTYKFPLAYPDWDLNSFMYLKRINLGMFFDYANGKLAATENHPAINENYYATGLELNVRAHFLSFVAPVDMRFRGIYYPDTKKTGFEFTISVDFTAVY